MSGNGGWDPDEVSQFAQRAGDSLSNFVRRSGAWVLVGILALAVVFTSYYQIEPDEVGIVTRFGGYAGTSQPGLHFKLPLGIDDVTKVPVQRQLKQEFGFRTVSAGVNTEYERTPDAMSEAVMLTGDLNVADVEWIIQYQIRDPKKYLFKVRHVEDTLRDMSEDAMRRVVGDHSVTEVLTIGREPIQIAAREHLQDLCNRYETGIDILQLVLQDVNPPAPVRPSFNEVNEAIQERERAINEAEAEYNRVIPEARGRAQQTLQEAEGYATQRVNRAKGDVAAFNQLTAEYKKAPKVTRTRIYLETLGEVLPAAERRVIVDDKLQGLVPLLQLTRKGGAE